MARESDGIKLDPMCVPRQSPLRTSSVPGATKSCSPRPSAARRAPSLTAPNEVRVAAPLFNRRCQDCESTVEVKLRESLLNCILQCYDPKEDRVILGTGESFSIYPYDVDIIMGLEDNGEYVIVDEAITLEDVPEKYKVRCTMEGMWIDDMVNIFDSDGPVDEDFDKSFVLFLVATILAPVSTDRFPISYYSLVQDASRIKDMNWNNFTLRFLKDNLASVKEENSYRWPLGNLALLQYTYWEKIRPMESHFFFSGRTSPLVKYWDEDQACKREIYEITFGRPVGMVVDDLSKEPTTEELLRRGANQFDMSTPTSMIDNSSNKLVEITNRLTSLEKVIAGVVEKDPRLVRCLEGEYGMTPERDGPSIHEPEDARNKITHSSRNQKKRKNNS